MSSLFTEELLGAVLGSVRSEMTRLGEALTRATFAARRRRLARGEPRSGSARWEASIGKMAA